jgi:hypothetical protein
MKKEETIHAVELNPRNNQNIKTGIKVRTHLKAGEDPQPILPGK